MMTACRLAGRLRAQVAVALLAFQAMLLFVPLHHAAHEASAGEIAASVPSIGSSCPDGCTEPGHAHHAHDAATCATCQASRVVFVMVRLGAPPVARTIAVEGRSVAHEVASAPSLDASSPRGPPAHPPLA